MSRTIFNNNFQQQQLSNFAHPVFLPIFPTVVPPTTYCYNPYLKEVSLPSQQPVEEKYSNELPNCHSNAYPLKMRYDGSATYTMRGMVLPIEYNSSLSNYYRNKVIYTPHSVLPIHSLYKNQSASSLYLNQFFVPSYGSPSTPLLYQNCDNYSHSYYNPKYASTIDSIRFNNNYTVAEACSLKRKNIQRNDQPVDAVAFNSSERCGSLFPAKSYISNAKTKTNFGEVVNYMQGNRRSTSVPADSVTQSKFLQKLQRNSDYTAENTQLKMLADKDNAKNKENSSSNSSISKTLEKENCSTQICLHTSEKNLKSESKKEFFREDKENEIKNKKKDEAIAEGVVKAVLKLNKTNDCTNEVQFREISIITINEDPNVCIMPNFLTSDECEKLLEMTGNRWERSKTSKGKMSGSVDDYVSGESETRTSYSAFLKKGETSLVKMIENRVAVVSKMPPNHVESLVVIKYEVEQYFKEHHDGDFRISTVLIYLNDVEEGGETYFPFLGMKIRPEKGTAVYWRNVDEQGKADMRLIHCGLPPLKHVKYVVNCFINKLPTVICEKEENEIENADNNDIPLQEPLKNC